MATGFNIALWLTVLTSQKNDKRHSSHLRKTITTITTGVSKIFYSNPYMKNFKISTAFFISLFILIAGCKEKEADPDSDQPQPIKSISEKIYWPVDVGGNREAGNLAESGHNKKSFDQNGIHFQTEHYDQNMMLTQKVVFFRANDRVIREEYFGSNGNVEMKKTFDAVSETEDDFEIFD